MNKNKQYRIEKGLLLFTQPRSPYFYGKLRINGKYRPQSFAPISNLEDAKIKLIIYESLTCSFCADFHNKVYPELKKEFIDTGIINIEFRNFPLDMAALNASKLAHCNNDGKSDLLHFLYSNQKKWAKGSTIEELNSNLSSVIKLFGKPLDEEKCFSNTELEAFILNERIEGVKEFDINSTPTLILNDQKFEKTLSFKNLKKAIEKLL